MVKYSELFRKLKQDGWYVVRHTGSHMIMLHPLKKGRLVFPNHGSKEVNKGLLKSIVKQSGINLRQR